MHRGFVQIWWSRHVYIIGLTAPCLYHLAWSVSGSPALHQQRTLYLFLSLFSPPFKLNLCLGNHGSAWRKVEVMSFQKLLLILQCSNAAAGSLWGSPSVAVYSKIKLDVSLSTVQLIIVISMYSHFPRGGLNPNPLSFVNQLPFAHANIQEPGTNVVVSPVPTCQFS